MPLITTDSIILQVFQYGETSKILRVLTAQHGVQSAIARGALRPRSRFGGVLEPFSEGVATLFVKEGRELQTLAGFELTASHQALGESLLRFGGASLLAEIVLRTASEEPQPGLFAGTKSAVRRIQDAPTSQLETVILSEAWRLVARLGFAPALRECVACGRRPRADEGTLFDHTSGGILCETCAVGAMGRQLPAGARADLIGLVEGEPVRLERTEAHWQLLRRYLAHHVLDGAPLRTFDFLAEAVVSGSCDD